MLGQAFGTLAPASLHMLSDLIDLELSCKENNQATQC